MTREQTQKSKDAIQAAELASKICNQRAGYQLALLEIFRLMKIPLEAQQELMYQAKERQPEYFIELFKQFYDPYA